MPGRLRSYEWRWARLVLAVILPATTLVVAGLAPPTVAAAPPSTSVTEAPTELAAMTAARRQGGRVEVTSLRDEFSQTFALPGGQFLLESHLRPQRVRRPDGSWTAPDPTLRRNVDGMVTPAAAMSPMAFSGGGTVPMAKLVNGTRSMSLWWPAALPEPVLIGNIARYTEVLPGVDLEIRAEVDSFSHLLVVKTRAAAANPAVRRLRLRTDLRGVVLRADPVTGAITAVDAAGAAVVRTPSPVMWEAPDAKAGPDDRAEPREAAVRVEFGPQTLTLVPDPALLDDPTARLPLTVDPTWTPVTGPRNNWSLLRKSSPTTVYFNRTSINSDDATKGVIRSGAVVSGGNFTDRSLFNMNVSAVRFKHINRAVFALTQAWAGPGCGTAPGTVDVRAVGSFGSNATWNNFTAWGGILASSSAVKRYGYSCGPGRIEFNVTGHVASLAGSGSASAFLGLRGRTEALIGDAQRWVGSEWKRYRLDAALEIQYNSTPNAPTTLSANARGCGTATAPTPSTTTTPVLSARASDVDLGQQSLTTSFHWWPAGSARNATDVVAQSTGNPGDPSATVPAGRLQEATTYVWQAVTRDDVGDEQWSAQCYLSVDASAPNPPSSVTSTAYSPTGFNGGVGVAGLFVLNPPAVRPEEVVEYAYTLDLGVTPANAPRVPARPTDRKGEVTLAPRWDGVNILRVWTVDASSRTSTTHVDYTFNVTRGTGEVAFWELDSPSACATGDGSQHGNALALTGATCVAGRAGVGHALSLNGSGAYAATAGQLMYPPASGGAPVGFRTDSSFTVAGWIYLPAPPDWNKPLVAVDGTRTSPFWLGYDISTNRWAMRVHHTDVDSPGSTTVTSTVVPTTGVWTHLAGTYDAQTRVIRIYVNGVQQAATATLPVAMFNATGRLTIGQMKWAGAASHFLAGSVDDIRVFQTVLDINRINLLSVPLKPTISFPNGAVADVGGTIAIRFDAGGDANVTSYKYGVDSAGGTPLTATPAAPGQPVTVNHPVTTPGTIGVFARTADGTGDVSQIAVATFQARAAASLSGVVRDSLSGAAIAGATVRLDPGGLSTTTAANGGYTFSTLTAGAYTVAALVGDRCALSAVTRIDVLGPTTQDLFLAPLGDAFGYTCRIQAQPFQPASAVLLTLTGDDAVAQVNLPFAVPFYGEPRTAVWVDTNGYLSFTDPGGSHRFDDSNIPMPAAPNAMVAPFWDDLVIDGSASVRTATTGSAPNRRFIVEWRNVYRSGDPTARLTTEVILAENGELTVNYSGLDTPAERGERAVTGIESPGGEVGVEFSYRQAVLTNDTAVVYAYPTDPVALAKLDVTGIVRDSATGNPVSGAAVSLAPTGRTTTTSADGRYTFADFEPGNYEVAAAVGQRCGTSASAFVPLVADTTVDLTLRPVTDGFGYTCRVQALPFVPANGTVLAITGQNDSTQVVTTPFPVVFFGQAYGSVHVSTNGFVAVIPPNGSHPADAAPIADPKEPNGLVAAFWRDLDVPIASASVRTATLGTAPNRRFVIEWRDVQFVGQPSTVKVTFEVIFDENGDITLNYAGLDNALERGGDAAVGIEDPTGSGGFPFSFAEPALASGQAIVFHPPAQLPVLAGKVFDAVTDAPVPGAIVSLQPAGTSTTTNADGEYVLHFVPGVYTVAVSAGGPCGRHAEIVGLELVAPVDISIPVVRATDGFGYTCEVTSTPYTPAALGSTIIASGNDVVVPVTMPFAVPFYGQSTSTIWVDSNGVVYFANPNGSFPDGHTTIPNAAAPDKFVAPYWADLTITGLTSRVRTGVIASGINPQFVIEWWDAQIATVSGNKTVTFQVILAEDGRITFNYTSLDSAVEQGAIPDGISVGIEDATGTIGLQYLVNQPLLRNGEAITFIPPTS